MLTAACSTPVTSLPPDQVVGDLSQEDARQLCEDVVAFSAEALADTNAELTCTLSAIVGAPLLDLGRPLTTSDLRSACRNLRDLCLDGELPAAPDPSQECDEVSVESDCTATVAELEACIRDALAQVEDVADAVSCDLLGTDREPPELPTEPPASCASLPEACSSVAPTGGGD